MFEKVFGKSEAYTSAERNVLLYYGSEYCHINTASEEYVYALETAYQDQDEFHTFWVTISSSRGDFRYYMELKKTLVTPKSPTVYSFILENYAIVILAVALLVEAKALSIEPGAQLLNECDFSTCSEKDEVVRIAPRVTDVSPERVEEICERYRPWTKENFVKGNQKSMGSVLPKVLQKIRVPIRAQGKQDVLLNLHKLSDNLALHMLVESKEASDLGIPDSYGDMSSQVKPKEWGMCSTLRLANDKLPSIGARKLEYLKTITNPPREAANPFLVRGMRGYINDLAAFRQNTQEEGAAVAAVDAGTNMDAAGLEDEGDQLQGTGDIYGVELVVSNYEFMDYAPEDANIPVEMHAEAPAQSGTEPLAGPNQGPNPVRPSAGCPTSGRPISSPPNAVRLNSVTGAGSANPEHELPKAPTACDRSATVARIGPDRTSAPKKSFVRSSDSSDIEIVSVDNVERSDAKTAESKRRKANKRQRSTDAGPQTNTRSDGDVLHVRRTASLGPQQCAHCVAARIGDSEGSDVAGDSSDLFDDMFRVMYREYMRRKRNKARRGPRMR